MVQGIHAGKCVKQLHQGERRCFRVLDVQDTGGDVTVALSKSKTVFYISAEEAKSHLQPIHHISCDLL